MQIKSLNEQIRVWQPADFPGIELRRGFSVSQPYPKHWHEEFHFCLVLSGGGTLNYRRERHQQRVGSLSIVHPGEVHSNQAFDSRGCSFRNLYAAPEVIGRLAAIILGKQSSLPFFTESPLYDSEVIQCYLKLHEGLDAPSSKLEQDELLLNFLAALLARHSESRLELAQSGRESEAVLRVREYLTENFAENVSLDQMATVARLSPYHLNREFSREFGLPPHAFQTQIRIERAKLLLRQGAPISQTAFAVGFVDQSHFTRHFRRLVAITPGHYQQVSKNVQD